MTLYSNVLAQRNIYCILCFSKLSTWTLSPVTAEKDQLTTGESPCDGMERQLTGGNRPHWDGHGVASHVCSFPCHWHVDSPARATKRRQKRTPLESARAGAEDDSSADIMVTDPGLEMTTSNKSTAQESATAVATAAATTAGHKQQICPCGWTKVTSYLGLRIHQGRMKCLTEGRQRPRIDSLPRMESNQSNEVQQRDANHSLQYINTTVMEEANTRLPTPEVEPSQPTVERRLVGHKLHVKWPGAGDKKLWETINTDLILSLEQLRGTVEKKLERMGDVIYQYGAERFGVQERSGGRKLPNAPVSRRQQEIKRLVLEMRQLRRQWKKASEGEKEGITVLQLDIKTRLASLRRAENLRKRRRKKEQTRTRFYKDPFKFLKTIFTKEKSGALKTTKADLEAHLKATHSDPRRYEHLTIPSDIPPIDPPEYHFPTDPPTWKEVENTVRKARTASAPGPNGVPYKVYKNTPDVLRFLWKLMRTAWQRKIVPKAWRRAGGVLIPKEKDAENISQFRPISLLNVEGKIFFSVIAHRMGEYLRRNEYIDTSVQKAGISGFSGCSEHSSMIWHQIQMAKVEKRDLHVVFLDLANAFGSVPHELLWSAFGFFHIPDAITSLVKSYFQDVQFCFNTTEFTTSWQCLEVGIMAGCTISPLAFTMAMEVIIRASKWVVGGQRAESGLRLPPLRAYMDDITTLTTTVPCTRRLLRKLEENISWARMKIKPSKSRSISIVKGTLSDLKFFIGEDAIPTVSEQPVKSLGRWYDASLKDKDQVQQLRKDIISGLQSIDNTQLPGKLKSWCLQFGLLPRMLWPLAVYEVPISTVEKLERTVTGYIKKWLGVPRCLTTIGLYGDSILKLPLSSLTEEFKCAKTRLQMTLNESRDTVVSNNAPALATGRKWRPAKAVEEAIAALKHADIVGHVQQGRGGFGLTATPPTWSKATAPERRKMVVEEVRHQEEAARWAKAVSLGKQGQWTRWDSVERRKISWKDMWAMEARQLSFSIRATYDVLPTPVNLHQWFGEEPGCALCSMPATLRHILTGCKTSLAQGRYTWRHNQVLKVLASALEDKRAATNSLPPPASKQQQATTFVREGAKATRGCSTPSERGQLRLARDWEMLADIGRQLVFPREIATTTLRPDLVLWSPSLKKVYIIELTVPWEDAVDEAYERKHLRYAELAAEAQHRGWNAEVRPVEVGCRGFVARSATGLFADLGIRGRDQRSAIKAASEAAERSSQWLFMRRKDPCWAPK